MGFCKEGPQDCASCAHFWPPCLQQLYLFTLQQFPLSLPTLHVIDEAGSLGSFIFILPSSCQAASPVRSCPATSPTELAGAYSRVDTRAALHCPARPGLQGAGKAFGSAAADLSEPLLLRRTALTPGERAEAGPRFSGPKDFAACFAAGLSALAPLRPALARSRTPPNEEAAKHPQLQQQKPPLCQSLLP